MLVLADWHEWGVSSAYNPPRWDRQWEVMTVMDTVLVAVAWGRVVGGGKSTERRHCLSERPLSSIQVRAALFHWHKFVSDWRSRRIIHLRERISISCEPALLHSYPFDCPHKSSYCVLGIMGVNNLLPHLPGWGDKCYHSFYGLKMNWDIVPLDAAGALWQFAASHPGDFLRGNHTLALTKWARFLN